MDPESRGKRPLRLFLAACAAALFLVLLFATSSGQRAQFIAGGALINLGYRMQDHLERYDFEHHHEITPAEILKEIEAQNDLAATVRESFPRTHRHPLVAMVVCMDARIDSSELMGDTRKYYYIIRTAGSVISEREQEMLELAVENGVKAIVLTTHTDCAAERAAKNPEKRARYPALANAVDERPQRFAELLARPAIASRIAAGTLAVKILDIDTHTERLLETAGVPRGGER